jgi:hypothetical protein
MSGESLRFDVIPLDDGPESKLLKDVFPRAEKTGDLVRHHAAGRLLAAADVERLFRKAIKYCDALTNPAASGVSVGVLKKLAAELDLKP